MPIDHRHFGFRCLSGAALVVVAGSLGCSLGTPWKPPRMPWDKPAPVDSTVEKYGGTANDRIKDLVAQSKAATEGGSERVAAFTDELARTLLTEHDPRVRVEILRLAAEYDTPSALAICRGALDDPDERVRLAACDAWGKRGGEEAVKLLAHRYQTDTEIDVRLRAIRMLGSVKDASAIPVLAKALEDSDPAVQYRAVAALKQVSGRDLGDDVNKWRAWAADPAAEPEWSMAETFRKLF